MNQHAYYYPTESGKEKEAIKSFFENYPLDEAKNKLWELLKAAMENDQYVLDEKPSNTIYFYENLCDLITASHQLVSKPGK